MKAIKFDADKAPLSLIDPRFTEEVARVLATGEAKYGISNWRGLTVERLLDAVKRHILELEKSNDYDHETDLHHAAHAASGLMFIRWIAENRPEQDDRRWASRVPRVPAVGRDIQPQPSGEVGLRVQPVPEKAVQDGQTRATRQYSTGTIAEVQQLISGWADRTFPERTIGEAVLKLKKELTELDTSKYLDAGEFADVAILLLDIGHLAGIDIAKAVANKMAINEKRVWEKLEDGTHQHVIDGGRTEGVAPVVHKGVSVVAKSVGVVQKPLNIPIEKYLCVVCGQRFSSQDARKRHYLSQHNSKKV